MKSSIIAELILSITFIILLISFLNPIRLMMPESIHPFLVPSLIILFLFVTGFMWKEVPGDERGQLHKRIASRFAYFAGVTTLVISIICESYEYGKVDVWLIIALCIMMLTKILGFIYSYFRY